MVTVNRRADPPADDLSVELRIDGVKAGDKVNALMTPDQARIVAYQLLQAAVEIEQLRKSQEERS